MRSDNPTEPDPHQTGLFHEPTRDSTPPLLSTCSQASSPFASSQGSGLSSSQNNSSMSSNDRRNSIIIAQRSTGLILQARDGSNEMIFLSGDLPTESEELGDVFEEISPLGRGTEGVAYPAGACVDGDVELVVIKKSSNHRASNGHQIHRILTEKHESSADHNVLKLLGTEIRDHTVYSVLPYCHVFLDKVMTLMKSKSMAPVNPLIQNVMIAQIGSDILEALRYMHTFPHKNGIGYVHRDIKPANIALKYSCTGWHAAVSDFGTAEEMNRANTPQAGTLPFMHPACFTNKYSDCTAQNDLYQLGVTLLVLLENSQTVLPPATLTAVRDVMRWKENKYHLESAQYETAKKAAELERMNAQKKAMEYARMRILSGFPHVTLTRELHPKVYPTLEEDLQHCPTIENKLTMIGLHLTRCFEQPTTQEVESAFAKIKKLLIQSYPQGKDALHQEVENFYADLASGKNGKKPPKTLIRHNTTSSFFRDYTNRATLPQSSKHASLSQ